MKEKKLVLLAGQSNMSGRGYLTENDIYEIPGLTAIRRDLQWIPAIDPFNYDRLNLLGFNASDDPYEIHGLMNGEKRRCGVGPGRTFGKLLMEKFPGSEVGLIPASVGGTAISCWMPGGKDDHSDMHPYDDAIVMSREAMKNGRIVAVLWHQGESDAARHTENYKDKLKTVIANIRKELDIADVPFILGGMGDFLNPEWDAPAYDRMIREVAEEVPLAGFASAAGLTDRGDNLHFSTESQYELARRYWAEYCRLAGL
ncbi:MAG: sialate O-acetylesterase [Lentisphaerae bacterium]|nr:sialate O-acetylesterase [Lentisphaerota bacterium]